MPLTRCLWRERVRYRGVSAPPWAESSDRAAAKRLLNAAELHGFTFQRIAPGEDGRPLVTSVTGRGKRLDSDGAVLVECPAGVVSDLPYVTVGISECPSRPTPLRTGRRPHDGATSLLGL